jgi:hypothetical protein
MKFVKAIPQAAYRSLPSLRRDSVYIQLSTHSGDGVTASVATVIVNDIDQLFNKYLRRGLVVSGKENSPVHLGPADQTWCRREFYVTDPSGNTLRFSQKL